MKKKISSKKQTFLIFIVALISIGVFFTINNHNKKVRERNNLNMGKICYSNQDYQKAIDYFNLVLDQNNKNIEAYYFKTNALKNLNDYDSAISVIEFGCKATNSQELKELKDSFVTTSNNNSITTEQSLVSNSQVEISTKKETTTSITIKNQSNPKETLELLPEVIIPEVTTTVLDTTSTEDISTETIIDTTPNNDASTETTLDTTLITDTTTTITTLDTIPTIDTTTTITTLDTIPTIDTTTTITTLDTTPTTNTTTTITTLDTTPTIDTTTITTLDTTPTTNTTTTTTLDTTPTIDTTTITTLDTTPTIDTTTTLDTIPTTNTTTTSNDDLSDEETLSLLKKLLQKIKEILNGTSN